MVALDAGITVGWGEIAWEAWEELTCEPDHRSMSPTRQ